MSKGESSGKQQDQDYAPAAVISGSVLRKMTEVRVDGKLQLDLWPVRKELAKLTAQVVEYKANNPGYTPAMLSEFTTRIVQEKFPGYDANVKKMNADIDTLRADYINKKHFGSAAEVEELKTKLDTATSKLAAYQGTVTKDVSRKKDGQYTCLDWAAMSTWVLYDSGEKDVSMVIGYYTDSKGTGYHAAPVVFDGNKENPQPLYVVETTATPETSFRKVVSGGDILKGDNLVTKHMVGDKPVLNSYGTRKIAGQNGFDETMMAIAPTDTVKMDVYKQVAGGLQLNSNEDITIRSALPSPNKPVPPTEIRAALPKEEAKLTIKRPIGLE